MDALDQLQPAEELTLRAAAERARGPRAEGPSRQFCDCGAEIPLARRAALPGVQTCIDCQREIELGEGEGR